MVASTILVLVIGVLALLGYVVYRARPTRFKLTAGIWKILTLNVEVDSEPEAKKLPEAEPPKALPESEQQKALPKGGS